MRYLEKSNSQREKIEWQLPGAAWGGKWGVVYRVQSFRFKDERSSGDWLHTDANVLNTSELYT